MPPGQLVSQPNTLALPFTISFGGVAATSLLMDWLPGYTGLYQFDVVVPAVPGGNAGPLTFTLNGAGGAQTLATAIGN